MASTSDSIVMPMPIPISARSARNSHTELSAPMHVSPKNPRVTHVNPVSTIGR